MQAEEERQEQKQYGTGENDILRRRRRREIASRSGWKSAHPFSTGIEEPLAAVAGRLTVSVHRRRWWWVQEGIQNVLDLLLLMSLLLAWVVHS